MRLLREPWYLLEYAVTRAVFTTVSLLPVRCTLLLGDAVAGLAYVLLPGRRRIAIDNIVNAGVRTDRREAAALARASFRTLAATVFETIVARRRIQGEAWTKHVEMKLPAATDELMREDGQGVLLATAHLGNWEAGARAASTIKPLTAIYKPFNNPYLSRWIRRQRPGESVRAISKYEDDPMRLIKALNEGEMLAIMMDQHARGESGIPVQFFGRLAKTMTSVAMLHLVTRAPIVVACAIRKAPLQYEILATEPIRHQRTGDRNRDVLEVTQRLSAEIEQMARAHPEQYMWGHRRWKYADRLAAAERASAVSGLRVERT